MKTQRRSVTLKLRKERAETLKSQFQEPEERNENKSNIVRFEAFSAVTMKKVVFWDVALCRSCINRRFGGTYRLHLQGILQIEYYFKNAKVNISSN
jgi:hypothetical protein